MRILVTGGAGFIGSNLVHALQARHPEARITVLDDFSSASFLNLTGFTGDVVCADMADPSWTLAVVEQEFDQIYHLAANTDTRVTDQALMMRQNVEAFRLLLGFCAEARTPIVYASSAATYGRREGLMKESDPPEPANVYAFSKAIMDNMASQVVEDTEGEWMVAGVKYFNVYGPRESHKGVPASMIYHLSNQMLEGKRPRIFEFGDQKRDFVHVDDVVDGTIKAMEAATAGLYNLGSGQARSFNELVKILNNTLGTNLEPEYFKNPFAFYQNHTEADLTRSREVLGYKPKHTLESGVASYMRWLHPNHVVAPGVGGA